MGGTQSLIGARAVRVDGRERVIGAAIYPADFKLSDVVTAGLLRSPHAHARIICIDTTRAAALDGVVAIVTADDFPDLPLDASIPMGPGSFDMWMVSRINMARDKVLWVGQPVVGVAAVDEDVLAEALRLIDVTYAPLEPVVDLAAAMAPDAPVLHAHVFTQGVEPKPQRPSNVCSKLIIARGDADAVLAAAVCTATMSVRVDTAHQGYLEPQALLAHVDASGFVTVYTSTQGQFTTELMLGSMLGLPISQIKVVPLEVGGAFGGKIVLHGEAVAVRLAQKCGRPVRFVQTRTEVLQGGSGPTAGALVDVTVGADGQGRLLAIKGTYRLDAGGLPGMSPTLPMQASAALYTCDALHLEGYDVVTNKPRTEAYRGPGGIQCAFAVEQAIDSVARTVGIDPLEFRLRNAAVTGGSMPIGTPFPSLGYKPMLEVVRAHPCWTDPMLPGRLPRGRGLAVGYWRGTSMTSSADISVDTDGGVRVIMGGVDLTGTRTSMAQVAADQFGVGLGQVEISTGDTKSAGHTDAAAGSRMARTSAAAVVDAAQKVLAILRTRAARALQARVEDIGYADGVFTAGGAPGPSIGLADLMRVTASDGPVAARGNSTNLPLGVEIGVHVCEVEVDTDTGHVAVLRYTAFQDVGRALNPAGIEGQIQGSVVQGLGWALFEGFDYGADGRLRNASLLDYRTPTAMDVPAVECVIVEHPVPDVPYGLRGVGEVPIVPVAAAVANAIADVTGVRITHMPMTPERVLAALAADR
jgi:CO/xanthine dehydrogenase Mo-binding subunit